MSEYRVAMLKGKEENLPDRVVNGQILFTTDTGRLYIDDMYRIRVNASSPIDAFRICEVRLVPSSMEIVGYVDCDGTQYQVEQFPKLVESFQTLYGDSYYFGGSSETQLFAVPTIESPSKDFKYVIRALDLSQFDYTTVEDVERMLKQFGNGTLEFISANGATIDDPFDIWGTIEPEETYLGFTNFDPVDSSWLPATIEELEVELELVE